MDIQNKKLILFAIKRMEDSLEVVPVTKKYLEIEDDMDNAQLRAFSSELYALLDSLNPSKMGLLARQTKGKFSASSASFKLEAIIQCYPKQEVTFVSKPKLTAFYKKNELNVSFTNAYQENAAKIAQMIGS